MSGVILVFHSIHHTLKAEVLLKATDFLFFVVPVPPFVNEGCGLGIKLNKEQLEAVQSLLEAGGIIPLKTVELA